MINFLKIKIIKLIRKKMVKLDTLSKKDFNKINSFGKKNPDKLFYVIRINYGGGLFSIVLYVLTEIKFAISINAIPIVDMEYFITKYNEGKKIKKTFNSWEYYFYNVSNYNLEEVYQSKNVIINSGVPDKKMPRDWLSDPKIYNYYYQIIMFLVSILEVKECTIPLDIHLRQHQNKCLIKSMNF